MGGTIAKPRPLKNCRGQAKADIWAVHPYTTGAPTHFPSSDLNMSVAALPRMVRLIQAANQAGKLKSHSNPAQVWATEFSWDSNPPDPGGLKPAIQSRWVAQAMYMMYKAQVNTMIWFGMRDEAHTPGRPWGESMESGLYFRAKNIADDRRKMVFRAFRFPFYAERTRAGVRFWGRIPDANSPLGKNRKTIRILARKRNGKLTQMKTVRANPNGVFAGAIRARGFTARGAVTAKIPGGESAIPFGLHTTKDFRQPPFGGP